jgi:hypothetical protein
MRFRALMLLALALLVACGQPASDNRASEQFLTERNDGTPVALGAAPANAPLVGEVEKVDGRAITVKPLYGGAAVVVTLAEGSSIRSFAPADRAALQPGVALSALGRERDGVFEAERIRIGDAGAADAGPVIMTTDKQAAPGDGTPEPGQFVRSSGDMTVGSGDMPAMLAGSIEVIDGAEVTLKTAEGTTAQFRIAPATVIEQRAERQPSELKPGATVAAFGKRDGDQLAATRVDLLTEAP